MKQTWTSRDGFTFDTEARCRDHEAELDVLDKKEQECLERIVSYVLKEAEFYDGYPPEYIALLKGIGVPDIVKNLHHLENMLSLVIDIKSRSEDIFYEWKDGDGYSEYEDFLPEERWMNSEMFKQYPMEELRKERRPLFDGLTTAFRDYPGFMV